MASIVLLAQALPTASSGVDWLYQFTNNLTNVTTQNGGVADAVWTDGAKLYRSLYFGEHVGELEYHRHDFPTAPRPRACG